MLHDAGAQGRFQSDDNLAKDPGWRIPSSHGVCQAVHLFVAVGNNPVACLHLTNKNQHIDVMPHTFYMQTELGDRKVSMTVLSTLFLTWYPAVCKVQQV